MPLQPCHSRRCLDGRTDKYFCAHPRVMAPGALVSPGLCLMCDLWKQPPPSNPRAFPPPPSPSIEQLRGMCVHLGKEIGLRECQSCQGRVRIKLYACHHPGHAETILNECFRCPDFNSRIETLETAPGVEAPSAELRMRS